LDILHKMAAELLEKEVLDGAEIDEIVRILRPQVEPLAEPQPAA